MNMELSLDLDFRELGHLWLMLAQHGVDCTVERCLDGYKVQGKRWDVAINTITAGSSYGYLELYYEPTELIIGCLSADDAWLELHRLGVC